jgi:hypothetical protein
MVTTITIPCPDKVVKARKSYSMKFKRDVLNMMEQWEDWMYASGGFVEGVTKTPSCKLVAEWIIDMHKVITEDTARNAWRKKGFEWITD